MLTIIMAGVYTSIQDLGRIGYGQYGVPISGVMDRYSAQLSNKILNNNRECAVLEITLGNIELLFDKQTLISVTGAKVELDLNGEKVAMDTKISLGANSRLKIKKAGAGVRTYLAIKGGFLTEKVLNSRSFFKAITKDQRLQKGAVVDYNPFFNTNLSSNAKIKIPLEHYTTSVIKAFKGPEYDRLSDKQKKQLKNTEFSIAKENNRMAYRLNEKLENKLEGILTSAVLPGTVQLTPSGQLVVLMRDCQVTGGYPRILQLTTTAVNQMAQKSTGHRFKFELVDN